MWRKLLTKIHFCQHPFMILKKKNLQKAGIEGTYLNIMKAIYDKPWQTLFSVVKN